MLMGEEDSEIEVDDIESEPPRYRRVSEIHVHVHVHTYMYMYMYIV